MIPRIRRDVVRTASCLVSVHAKSTCISPLPQPTRGPPKGLNTARSSFFDTLARDACKNAPVSTFASLLKECCDVRALLAGRHAHSLCVWWALEHVTYLGNWILSMYSKCWLLSDARSTFDRMRTHDCTSWNIMIGLYMQNRNDVEALKLFKKMQEEGIQADKFTFTSVLSACSGIAALESGRLVHANMLEAGLALDGHIASALINLYGKCGCLQDACKLFCDGPRNHDAITWNTMLTAYTDHGCNWEALGLYHRMLHKDMTPKKVTFLCVLAACSSLSLIIEGQNIHEAIFESGFELDILVATALVNMYSECDSLKDAQAVFDRMKCHDFVCWSAMINAYTEHSEYEKALLSFGQVYSEGTELDMVTFVSILCACANLAALTQGQIIHADCIESESWSTAALNNALLNMYGKCGSLVDSLKVFDSMCVRDVISWGTLIEVYASAGNAVVALELFSEMIMEGIAPNDVSFVNALSACSHAGRLDEGCYYFEHLTSHFNIMQIQGHFTSMVDLFGRAGCLDLAENIIWRMPFHPNSVIWETLLSACRFHGDVELGKQAALEAISCGSEATAPYILLANIYCAEGQEKCFDYLES